jgi:hypothetical protein
VERPLLAPLLAAVAAEVEELDVRAFLADAGRRSRLLADLVRAMPVDVLVVDSGSGWDAEAMGLVLDWGDGTYPPRPRGGPGVALSFDPARGGGAVVLDLLGRLRAVVPEHVALAVTLTGPATLAAACGPGVAPGDAVAAVLVAARTAAERGAGVVVVREDGAIAVDPAAYGRACGPLWGSLRFFRAAGVLQVSGSGDGWPAVLSAPGPFLPVFEPGTASAAATAMGSGTRAFGLALEPGAGAGDAAPARGGHCALLTHTRDLLGAVPVRDVRAAVAALGGA